MEITEREALERIQRGDIRLGPLRMSATLPESPTGGTGGTGAGARRIDMALALSWDAQRNDFFLEYRNQLTPKQLDGILPHLKRWQQQTPGLLPMVAAPFLSEAVIRRLVEERISGFDLSGNYVIIVPNTWFIQHTGEPNRFPSSQPIREIYRRTSSLVGRALLVRPEYGRALDLQEDIQRRGGEITKGTISKVLQALEEDVIIRRSPTIRLLAPERLLDSLAASYSPVSGREAMRAQAPEGFLELLAAEAVRRGIKVIGRDESLYTVAPRDSEITTFYSTDPQHLLSSLAIDRESRFPNIEVIGVRNPSVYFDPLERDGFSWCSRLQIYLELVRGGKREQDTAAILRESILREARPDG